MSARHRFPLYGWLALAILSAAQLLLLVGIEWVRYWFFPLAWWPYILVADGLVYRRRNVSLLTHHPREFALLLPWSIFFWLVFELFNVILNNWHYVMVPRHMLQRWAGYAVCYATVLPGLFETMELLAAYGFLERSRVKPISRSTRWYAPFVVTGLAFLALPLAWPQFFFPLVWSGFVFLLEPLNHRLGLRSLMREWEEGSLRTFFLLLTAGAICGLLWEFWNFWALTKWVYTVPYVGWLKVFEMPILGFLGFPPFTVACYVMMNTVCLLRQGRGWQDPSKPISRPLPGLSLLVGFVLVIFCLFAFHQIDIHTVVSWRP
ncbi:MAG: hypothetical protein JSU72_14005 [Deltaproteobacteria bacterium]|nr:MAG: hypothetical protein JSU72_14005 [Deltaproteobacteria bacterium]